MERQGGAGGRGQRERCQTSPRSRRLSSQANLAIAGQRSAKGLEWDQSSLLPILGRKSEPSRGLRDCHISDSVMKENKREGLEERRSLKAQPPGHHQEEESPSKVENFKSSRISTSAKITYSSGRYKVFSCPSVLLIDSAAEVLSDREAMTMR